MASIDELLEIPDFLRRTDTPEEIAAARVREARLKNTHPGALIKMPTSYRWSGKIEAIKVRKEVEEAKIMKKDVKKKKIDHPTTVAIKKYLGNLKGDDRRRVCYDIARENEINPQRWDHLNNGQVAMNLTNTIRGRFYKTAFKVYIGGEEVNDDYLNRILTDD